MTPYGECWTRFTAAVRNNRTNDAYELALHDSSGLSVAAILSLPALRVPGKRKRDFPISVASKTVGFVPVWVAWRMGYLRPGRFGGRSGFDARRGESGDGVWSGSPSTLPSDPPMRLLPPSNRISTSPSPPALSIGRAFSSWRRKTIRAFQDLRGATIGVTNISSGPAVALRYVLKAKGLEYPERLQAAARGSGRRAHHGHERGPYRCVASGCTFQLCR